MATDTMPRDVTPEEVRETLARTGRRVIPHHPCSICDYVTNYFVGQDGQLYFDPGCNCTRPTHRRSPLLRNWSDLSDWVNMQQTPRAKREVASRMDIEL